MPIRPVKDMVAEAKTRIQSLSPEEAQNAAKAGNILVVSGSSTAVFSTISS